MPVAERTDTAVPIIETLTKFGLESGATLEAAIFDPRVGVTNPWLADWSTGLWGNTKVTETLTEDDPANLPGRYIGHANVSGAAAGSTHLMVFIAVDRREESRFVGTVDGQFSALRHPHHIPGANPVRRAGILATHREA